MTYDGPPPLNREPATSALLAHFRTPADVAYDRNHGPIPAGLDATTHTVRVGGLVAAPVTLSVAQLATDFPQHAVTCALQCAGNRRHTMRTALREVSGIDWFDGAVLNAAWEGPRLVDVLARAGVPLEGSDSDGIHVAFESRAAATEDDEFYGGSIPLERALRASADVVLALRMNGEPLTRNHGFPVRVVVPGALGARSVKWLDGISVQKEESPCYYQRKDYKALPAHVRTTDQAEKEGWWERTASLLDMPVNSVVGVPEHGEKARWDTDGCVEVKGYALPAGEDGPIVKVEVRVDEGAWQEAELLDGNHGKWCWCIWRWKGLIDPGKRRIWSRATDKGGNIQEGERSEWNLRGVAYNGYGEVELEVV